MFDHTCNIPDLFGISTFVEQSEITFKEVQNDAKADHFGRCTKTC